MIPWSGLLKLLEVLAHRLPRDAHPVNLDLAREGPRGRRGAPGKDVEQGRLAGPGGAHDGHEAALLAAAGDPLQDFLLALALRVRHAQLVCECSLLWGVVHFAHIVDSSVRFS